MLRNILGLAVCSLALSYTCTNDDGCEQLGVCRGGVCDCLPGYTGPSCGVLDLAPAAAAAARVWPSPPALAAKAASAWGFSAVYDPADGLYHAFATTACGEDGVVGSGGGGSLIAHLVSAAPDSGFTLLRAFAPPTSFGPQAVVAQDGTFVVVFRVNALNGSAAVCAGNASTGPTPPLPVDIPASELAPGDPEHGTNIYVAWAARAAGPWSVVNVSITGAGNLHKSNPALAQLPDGRWVMGYRYNPAGGSLNAVAVSAGLGEP